MQAHIRTATVAITGRMLGPGAAKAVVGGRSGYKTLRWIVGTFLVNIHYLWRVVVEQRSKRKERRWTGRFAFPMSPTNPQQVTQTHWLAALHLNCWVVYIFLQNTPSASGNIYLNARWTILAVMTELCTVRTNVTLNLRLQPNSRTFFFKSNQRNGYCRCGLGCHDEVSTAEILFKLTETRITTKCYNYPRRVSSNGYA